MRLRSDLWVSAYVRKVNAAGAFAVVARRGAAEAGAIFVTVEDADSRLELYAPAPQSEVAEDQHDRVFRKVSADGELDAAQIADRLEREARFDPDFWVVAVEDRAGRHFLDNLSKPD